jgi:protein-tyrosine kinase
MSRIHEALKKAEQERAAAPGGGGEPNLVSVPLSNAPEIAENPAAVATVPMGGGGGSPVSFASPFSLDALLTRCPPVEWRPDPATMLFFNGDDSARGTEEFRTLRSRLYHAREGMSLKKVLVTSALPREGKSFTAANLAQVLVRQHGRRVLLVDADLRGPRLHEMLGNASSPGLSEYLNGQNDEFSIMQQGPLESLFFIPSGRQPENPAELVANGRLRFLLQRLEPLFDWIIIDSPPAVPVSDAGILARSCDGVLLVVRSNQTPFDIARKAREEFAGQTVVGVVLNGARDQSTYERYYYEACQKSGNGTKSLG